MIPGLSASIGIAGLSFLNPLFLLGLLALPVMWFLLRVMPPAPKVVSFPTLRFLKDLETVERSPSKTPWWLILLRMLAVGLVILALARPVLNPQDDIAGAGTLRIVLDNGWSAASTWDDQIRTVQDVLFKAKQAGRPLAILKTATAPGQSRPAHSGILSYGEAKSIIDGAEMQPWPSDYEAAAELVRTHETIPDAASVWVSSGISGPGFDSLARALESGGGLTFYRPEPNQTALLLKETVDPETGMRSPNGFTVLRAAGAEDDNRPFTVHALSRNGEIIESHSGEFTPRHGTAKDIVFDFPQPIIAELSYLRLSHSAGAGGTYLLSDRYVTKTVGIVSRRSAEDATPLVEDSYYLTRALQPYAELHSGTIDDLLSKQVNMMILPDIAAMPVETLNRLSIWVENGGLLVNFAGPNTAETTPELVPVELRKGGRALEGVMTWEEPLLIGDFPKESPFFGFEVPDDVKIRQMVLAQPGPDLEGKTWAKLEDGTPLITSAPLGKGRMVLIHTTATPKWSDLPLSGLYVEILNRLTKMAGQSAATVQEQSGTLMPEIVLDGRGRLKQPESFVKPIPADTFASVTPNAFNPPGIYGRSGYVQALNLGDRLDGFELAGALPAGAASKSYDPQGETRLMPGLLAAAFTLALLDWIIVLALSGLLFNVSRRTGKGTATAGLAGMIVVLTVILAPAPAPAETSQDAVRYATDMHLAYIKTPNDRINTTARVGLEQLARVLRMRTSVEPEGVAEIDLSQDNLAFFPFIYWPVTSSMPDLSAEQAQKIQTYMDNGGMILFDTRDQPKRIKALQGISESENAKALRRLLQPVNVPPLVQVPEDHVLTKSFYLLQDFPGKYSGGALWVEQASTDPERRTGLDGVTRILIGSNDWAGAWASTPGNRNPAIATSSRQQEMAFRFGVNVVMYALTGNYKSDQVHVPFILERLGQ